MSTKHANCSMAQARHLMSCHLTLPNVAASWTKREAAHSGAQFLKVSLKKKKSCQLPHVPELYYLSQLNTVSRYFNQKKYPQTQGKRNI